MQKKRYKFYNEYTFPDTSFTVAASLAAAGDMGRELAGRNRLRFYEEIGVAQERVRTLNQIHSKNILLSSGWNEGCAGDGIISREPSEVIGVTSADCVPVFLYHPSGTVFAAFHSGWKGTGIVSTGIEGICNISNVSPKSLIAFIGPAIGSCCYNVEEERGELFRDRYGEAAAVYRDGRWYLDLQSVNASLIADAGVETVYVDSDCTCCTARYGSYRRQGPESFTLMLSLGRYG